MKTEKQKLQQEIENKLVIFLNGEMEILEIERGKIKQELDCLSCQELKKLSKLLRAKVDGQL